MIEIVKTSFSVLPWRLHALGKPIPHANCRTKRDALALKASLEAAADWRDPLAWDEGTAQAVRELLAATDSARLADAAHRVRW
jgi:hypothetical protein